ncbi:hypothetical protein DL768_011018 [Monosporascus sp. mg162]|nr:hypothetical protein DL768_011018 [Monosporascus sp. mg162]
MGKDIDTHRYDSLIELLQKWQLAGVYMDDELRSPSLDLNEHGGLGLQSVISAADFGAYKPNPQTYLGAVYALGLEPHEVAMAAAHLYDLNGAGANGLRTIYVERAREGVWGPEEDLYPEARSWVDLWVGEQGEAFVEAGKATRNIPVGLLLDGLSVLYHLSDVVHNVTYCRRRVCTYESFAKVWNFRDNSSETYDYGS